MSSWSPPAALKSTGDEKKGGTLARENGKFVYDRFAQYWADSLPAYKKVGIVPTWVSIQNEPDWKADWETCLFQPTESTDDRGVALAGYDKALAAVYRRFRATPGGAPKLLGPEPLGIGGRKVQNYLGSRGSVTAKQVDGVAYHLYYGGDHQAPDTFIPALRDVHDAYPNKSKWMTEFGRSDGFQTAWCIHNTLVEGNAAAYVYWAGIWPGIDTLINIDNPFNARSSWKHPNGFEPTDRYYGLKHYSYFIGPGYKRVDVGESNAAVKVSAYISPDRSRLVAVALNTSTTVPANLSLAVKGYSGKPSATYRSVLPPPAVTPTEGEKVGVCGPGERFRTLATPKPGGSVSLPPRSIVTVVFGRGK
jgi:glucuronoarabinoxylan endo-1,4-beta-xylanase